MFCEESLGKIKFRAFPERVGPRILSLESVDYFGTYEHFSGRKQNLCKWVLWWACRRCRLFSAMIEMRRHVLITFFISGNDVISRESRPLNFRVISIGNNMICSDIWRRYHEWYFEFLEPLGEWNLRQFSNITSVIYTKYHVQIIQERKGNSFLISISLTPL